MKHSIGMWMDSKLQQQIKCLSQEKDFENLQLIYEKMYDDPSAALNQIRQHGEKLFKTFFNKNNLGESNFSGRLSSCNKLYSPNKEEREESNIKKYFKRTKHMNNTTANAKLDLIYSHGNLIRVYGNSGSHSGSLDKKRLAEMALTSFIAFFELYRIFTEDTSNKDTPNFECENFNDFLYDKLEVIYETKDDVEEWEKIRFNKLKYNYNLYQIEGDIKKGKVVLDEIIKKEKELSSSKNIYFLNLNNYKTFKEMYQNLEDIDEEEYFKIKKITIDTDTIDMIPLRLLPKDENNPYKWDMCYINFSIELEDFGLDLILFLNFSQEKLNNIVKKYELEFMSL